MGYISCTSNKCEWVVPKERPLEPAMLQDMAFKRSKHGKTGKTRTLNGNQKKTFNVLPEDNGDENFLVLMLIHLTKPRGRNHMLSKKIQSKKIVVQLILSNII